MIQNNGKYLENDYIKKTIRDSKDKDEDQKVKIRILDNLAETKIWELFNIMEDIT